MKTCLFLLLTYGALFSSGCSGINASKSVSPMDFIVPGLMYHTAPIPVIPSATNNAPWLAGTSNFLSLPAGKNPLHDQPLISRGLDL